MSTDSRYEDDPQSEDDFGADSGDILYEDQVVPEHGILGLTLRELLIVSVWLVIFVTSFFPLYVGGPSLWERGLQWILSIAVPTVAVFLIVLRRFSPEGIRRVGSLGIDQFASVAFTVAAVFWLQTLWDQVFFSISASSFAVSWLTIVQLIGVLVLVMLTVFAPLIPGIREDFRGRLETLAHRVANPVRPVISRPRAADSAAVEPVAAEPAWVEPVAAEPAWVEPAAAEPAWAEPAAADSVAAEPAAAEAQPAEPAAQPFWILAPSVRDVHDATGEPVFRIGPDAWALVIEDRGGAYVVRDDDGRIGFLHDISDITKG